MSERTADDHAATGDAGALERRLGVRLDPELLVLALTHRSFAYEAGGLPTNERLEFLGDSVLGFVVTERLYRQHPDEPEGVLAKMRAASVSQQALAGIGRELGVGDFVLLGKGERTTGGRDKASILSDTVEALIGAIYLCHGLEPTRAVVERLVAPSLARAATAGAGLDWKTSLQEAAARAGLGAPTYVVTGDGPDHARVFSAQVVLAGEVRGRGHGASKKVAEQDAAEAAYADVVAGGVVDGAWGSNGAAGGAGGPAGGAGGPAGGRNGAAGGANGGGAGGANGGGANGAGRSRNGSARLGIGDDDGPRA